jgi:AcrR family transcriptional regulator
MTDTTSLDTTPAPRIDGRNALGPRTKAAILAACRELMQAGAFRPPMREVCWQAEVSVRSGFQYFNNVDGLYVAAAQDEATRDAILRHALGDDWQQALRWHDRADKLVRIIVTSRAEREP